MTSGERYKIFKEWFDSIGFPEMHSSYKDAMWQGFEAGHRKASNINEAAPELLEALQELFRAGQKQNWNERYESEMNAARAAINKALGE